MFNLKIEKSFVFGLAVIFLSLMLISAPAVHAAGRTVPQVHGFGDDPVTEYRPLKPIERARISAWNRKNPHAAIEPDEADSAELHFLKHAYHDREFFAVNEEGERERLFDTVDEYERAAVMFSVQPADGTVIRRFTRENGDVITVNMETGDFSVVTSGGRIRTFFNPGIRRKGIFNVRYVFDRGKLMGYLKREMNPFTSKYGAMSEIDYDTDELAKGLEVSPEFSELKRAA